IGPLRIVVLPPNLVPDDHSTILPQVFLLSSANAESLLRSHKTKVEKDSLPFSLFRQSPPLSSSQNGLATALLADPDDQTFWYGCADQGIKTTTAGMVSDADHLT